MVALLRVFCSPPVLQLRERRVGSELSEASAAGEEVSDDDRFRYCVWCKVDCYEDEPEHADDCPQTTGLRPVREEDLGPTCAHCGKPSLGGIRCMDCGEEIKVGEFYVLRNVDDRDEVGGNPFVGEVICVGCGANTVIES